MKAKGTCDKTNEQMVIPSEVAVIATYVTREYRSQLSPRFHVLD